MKIFKIGEVAKMLNVSKSTIYQWEKQGVVKPYKSETAHRRFYEEHITKMRKLLGIR